MVAGLVRYGEECWLILPGKPSRPLVTVAMSHMGPHLCWHSIITMSKRLCCIFSSWCLLPNGHSLFRYFEFGLISQLISLFPVQVLWQYFPSFQNSILLTIIWTNAFFKGVTYSFITVKCFYVACQYEE